ncbi:RNA polymerase sigma factor, sigma-70 family [Planctomicrobium piriforme]|uniref:RNA polymerase sigma factor, sigma-70 family n=2 Tax=Planctomicrobium piriforme TaxID=1576369 RepID=A0A1I3RWT3_9PLAN|nr:RNA polymerase sigma factor, sigma-70 family [Planctomicrobium piriforme]
MPPETPLTEWLQKLKAGDAQAMQQMWQHFFEQLRNVADNRLNHLFNAGVDGEDVAASVFESLWRAAAEGRLAHVQDVDELLWMLLAMTRRKCIDSKRRQMAYRRGGGRTILSLGDSANLFREIVTPEPDPEYLVALNDEFQRVLSKLKDPVLQRIAVLRIEGYTFDEIATLLGLALATIRRKLRLIRQTYRAELDND